MTAGIRIPYLDFHVFPWNCFLVNIVSDTFKFKVCRAVLSTLGTTSSNQTISLWGSSRAIVWTPSNPDNLLLLSIFSRTKITSSILQFQTDSVMSFLTKKSLTRWIVTIFSVLRVDTKVLYSFLAITSLSLSSLFISWSFTDPKDSQVNLFFLTCFRMYYCPFAKN